MKQIILVFSIAIIYLYSNAQKWTAVQLTNANTAADIPYLTSEEKEAIKYINLARLYPKQFAKEIVAGYHGDPKYGDYLYNSSYKKTLITELLEMRETHALNFDEGMYQLARCFAIESGKTGYVGHERRDCKTDYGGECCSYGMKRGLDIALQLLIDDDIPSLGHRRICLSNSYTKIGVSIASHKRYETCAVLDFLW